MMRGVRGWAAMIAAGVVAIIAVWLNRPQPVAPAVPEPVSAAVDTLTTAVAALVQSRDSARVAARIADARLDAVLHAPARRTPRPVPPADTHQMVPRVQYDSLAHWATARVTADSVALATTLAALAGRDSTVAHLSRQVDTVAAAATRLQQRVDSLTQHAATVVTPERCRVLRLLPCPSRRTLFVAGIGVGVALVTGLPTLLP